MGKRGWIDIFLKKTYKWATDTKKYLMSLIIREMQIKTTIICSLRPGRMATVKKTSKCWWGSGGKGSLLIVGVNVNWCIHYAKQCRGSWKIKNRTLPYYIAISLLGIYLKKIDTWIGRDTGTPMFTAALLTTAKKCKHSKCPL